MNPSVIQKPINKSAFLIKSVSKNDIWSEKKNSTDSKAVKLIMARLQAQKTYLFLKHIHGNNNEIKS